MVTKGTAYIDHKHWEWCSLLPPGTGTSQISYRWIQRTRNGVSSHLPPCSQAGEPAPSQDRLPAGGWMCSVKRGLSPLIPQHGPLEGSAHVLVGGQATGKVWVINIINTMPFTNCAIESGKQVLLFWVLIKIWSYIFNCRCKRSQISAKMSPYLAVNRMKAQIPSCHREHRQASFALYIDKS